MLAHQISSDDQRRAVDCGVDKNDARVKEQEQQQQDQDRSSDASENRVTQSSGVSNDQSYKLAPTTASTPTTTTSARQRRAVEVRLLVRRREAGALIGKRGANIKRLRALFHESAFNIPDTGNGPERVVCVSTNTLERLQLILEDVLQLFQDKQTAHFARTTASRPTIRLKEPIFDNNKLLQNEQIEVKLLINSSHAGLLIGVGGQSIRKLRNDSRAAIKIYEMCCPLSSERVCAIKAKPPVVVSTIRMIHELVSPTPIKGAHKPYDALNFDLTLVDRYGGYTSDDDCCTIAAAASSPLLPFDLMQHLQASFNDQTLPSSPNHHHQPLLLQNHAVQLLTAAAAAAAAATSDPARHNMNGFNPHALRNPYNKTTTETTTTMPHCDRFAEKYNSIIKASEQALATGRFHPYALPQPPLNRQLNQHQAASIVNHAHITSSNATIVSPSKPPNQCACQPPASQPSATAYSCCSLAWRFADPSTNRNHTRRGAASIDRKDTTG